MATLPLEEKATPEEEGIVADMLTGLRSLPHLPAALLHGVDDPNASDEERMLRRRSLSEAANIAIPLLVSGGAGLLLRGSGLLARPLVTAIIDAAGLGAGAGISASIQGEDVVPAVAGGALIGGAFGAARGVLGKVATKGAAELADRTAIASAEAVERAAKTKLSKYPAEIRSKLQIKDGQLTFSDAPASTGPHPGLLGDDVPGRNLREMQAASIDSRGRLRLETGNAHTDVRSLQIQLIQRGHADLSEVGWVEKKTGLYISLKDLEATQGDVERAIMEKQRAFIPPVSGPETMAIWNLHRRSLPKFAPLNSRIPAGRSMPPITQMELLAPIPTGTPVDTVIKGLVQEELFGPGFIASTERIPPVGSRTLKKFGPAIHTEEVALGLDGIPPSKAMVRSIPRPRGKGGKGGKLPPETHAADEVITSADDAAKEALSSGVPIPGVKKTLPILEEAQSFLVNAFAPARIALNRMGPAGTALAAKLDSAIEAWRRTSGPDIDDVRKLLGGLGKKERIHIGRVMEGLENPKDEAAGKIASALTDMYEKHADELEALGIRTMLPSGAKGGFRRMESYLTHYYDPKYIKAIQTPGTKEYDAAIATILAKGAAPNRAEAAVFLRRTLALPAEFRTGPVNFARTNLLGNNYERDPLKVMSRYIYTVRKRMEMAREFGHDYKGVNEFYTGIAGEAGEAGVNVAKRIFSAAQDALPHEYPALVKLATTWNIITMLSTSGIVQPAQLFNTAAVVGYKNLLKALTLLKNPEARAFADRTGAYVGEVMQDMMGLEGTTTAAQFWLKYVTGLEPLDKANRMISAVAGRFHAEDVARNFLRKQTSWGEQQLAKLGLDPAKVLAQGGKLTDEQLSLAGYRVSLQTQFASDVLDLPVFRNSSLGRVLFQFRSFSLQQSEFLRKEILRPAKDALVSGGKRGSLAPLMKYAAGVGPAGYAIGSLVRTIKGRPEPSDERIKLIENLALAGSFGIVYDTITSMTNGSGRFLSFLTGPTGGELANLASGGGELAFKGNAEPLAKWAVRRVPLIGQALSNYLIWPRE